MHKEKDDLELFQALSGAENVRSQLLTLLSIGPQNLYSTCYAIKARVKTEHSLREKITRKRKTDPTYNAARVTDIVGLRMLAIYSEDLGRITFDFLSFIEFCQSPKINLVPGSKFQHATTEIIIYSSEGSSGAYKKVESRLRTLLNSCHGSTPRLESRMSPPEEAPYSSIHIVFNAITRVGETVKTVPVEVQIRTIFEDAWGEIDHSLRYKGMLTSRGEDDYVNQRREANKSMLSKLGRQLHLCGDQADLIKADCDAIASQERLSAGSNIATLMTVALQFRVSEKSSLYKDGVAKDKFRKTEGEILKACGEALTCNSGETERVAIDIDKALKALQSLGAQLRLVEPGVETSDDHFFLHSKLLESLAIFRKAIMGSRSGRITSTGFRADVDQGLAILYDLEKDTRYQRSAYVKFRIANYWQLLGDIEPALEKLREAAAVCEGDVTIRQDGLVPVLISRQRAVIAHEAAMKRAAHFVRFQGSLRGFGGGVELLEEAINASWATVEALEKASPERVDVPLHYSREANNFVTYYWDFVSCARKAPQVPGPFDPVKFAEKIKYGSSPRSIAIGRLDSLCKALIIAGRVDDAAVVFDELNSRYIDQRRAGSLREAEFLQIEESVEFLREGFSVGNEFWRKNGFVKEE